MSFARSVEPEWLDELPATDARAMRSRRDLRRINAWMLQTRIMAHLFLQYCAEPPKTILELGSGDGSFMLSVAHKLSPRWKDIRVLLLDRQNIVSAVTRAKFFELGWRAESVTADVFEFFDRSSKDGIDLICANLFLHHFQPGQLQRLFAAASQTAPLFIACEPRRSGFALAGSHMLFAIGCNDVSRHDAVVSVRAGFSARELSSLWPQNPGWTLHERGALPFTHCFAAQRTAGADDV